MRSPTAPPRRPAGWRLEFRLRMRTAEAARTGCRILSRGSAPLRPSPGARAVSAAGGPARENHTSGTRRPGQVTSSSPPDVTVRRRFRGPERRRGCGGHGPAGVAWSPPSQPAAPAAACAAWRPACAGGALARVAPGLVARATSARVMPASTARTRSRLRRGPAPPPSRGWPGLAAATGRRMLTSERVDRLHDPHKRHHLAKLDQGKAPASAAATIEDGSDGRATPVSMAKAATPRSASWRM